MTKKQFKQFLLMGRGESYLLAKDNPNEYKDIILWACTHKIFYDTYNDDYNASYLYQFIKLYDDQNEFYNRIVACYKKTKYGEKFNYLSWLLICFYRDEKKEARELLMDNFLKIYYLIAKNKSDANSLSSFDELATILAYDKKSYLGLEIIIDSLRKHDKNFSIDKYETITKRKYLKIKEDKIVSSKIVTKEEIIDLFNKYQKEKKAIYLQKILYGNYKLDVSKIIDVSEFIFDINEVENDVLYYIFQLFYTIKNNKVKKWARQNINDNNFQALLPIIIRNYKDEDENLILHYLRKYHYSFYNEDDNHLAIETICKQKKIAKSIIYYAYNHCYCSFCRINLFLLMKKRNILLEDMKIAHKYDALEEIKKINL